MANRVVLGKLPDGNFGLLVSKPTENVLTTAAKNMLFDSRLNRTGQVYAGANNIGSIGSSGDNFLTTNSKSSLGYIPLVIVSEKNKGETCLQDDILEMLVILSHQIAMEYKDLNVVLKQGIPEIIKEK